MQTDAHAAVRQLCEEIRTQAFVLPQSSKMRETLECVSYEIETITRAYMTPTIADVWPGAKPQHKRILTRLAAKIDSPPDYWVPREQLEDALYWDTDKDKAVHPKIVHVLVTQCRAYLKTNNLPYRIVGRYSSKLGGWRMERIT